MGKWHFIVCIEADTMTEADEALSAVEGFRGWDEAWGCSAK